ncbi:hypothetical protein [Clostridium senegalense]|nr:hypothetical protein [Clostridium senegalense]
MINEIPTMIYDNLGNQLKVVRNNKIFLKIKINMDMYFMLKKLRK